MTADLVVALHGHGGHPTTVRPHAARIAPGARLVVPQGPLPVPGGFAWFDDGDHDLAPALATIDRAVADAQEIEPAARTVLVGTSQGAAAALVCALRPAPRPRLHAVVAITGFLPDPDALVLDAVPADDRPAVFLWAGEDDHVVPSLRVRAAAKVLARHGLEVELVVGAGGHEVGEAALAAAHDWLASRTD